MTMKISDKKLVAQGDCKQVILDCGSQQEYKNINCL